MLATWTVDTFLQISRYTYSRCNIKMLTKQTRHSSDRQKAALRSRILMFRYNKNVLTRDGKVMFRKHFPEHNLTSRAKSKYLLEK